MYIYDKTILHTLLSYFILYYLLPYIYYMTTCTTTPTSVIYGLARQPYISLPILIIDRREEIVITQRSVFFFFFEENGRRHCDLMSRMLPFLHPVFMFSSSLFVFFSLFLFYFLHKINY